MNDKGYLLDGVPVSFTELVKAAEEIGYYAPSGIYTTSEAAKILRDNSHVVERNKPGE